MLWVGKCLLVCSVWLENHLPVGSLILKINSFRGSFLFCPNKLGSFPSKAKQFHLPQLRAELGPTHLQLWPQPGGSKEPCCICCSVVVGAGGVTYCGSLRLQQRLPPLESPSVEVINMSHRRFRASWQRQASWFANCRLCEDGEPREPSSTARKHLWHWLGVCFGVMFGIINSW